jgi:hypothetical protein
MDSAIIAEVPIVGISNRERGGRMPDHAKAAPFPGRSVSVPRSVAEDDVRHSRNGPRPGAAECPVPGHRCFAYTRAGWIRGPKPRSIRGALPLWLHLRLSPLEGAGMSSGLTFELSRVRRRWALRAGNAGLSSRKTHRADSSRVGPDVIGGSAR